MATAENSRFAEVLWGNQYDFVALDVLNFKFSQYQFEIIHMSKFQPGIVEKSSCQ
jgi:hypothetical protein